MGVVCVCDGRCGKMQVVVVCAFWEGNREWGE